ncbi:MAG: thioredoxin family protein [Thaumarchaeota archaeon]|nr:thioredoxin family protein [Nitrososphaerota archaeon]
MIEDTSDALLEKTLKDERPVVIMFYATYCPYSRRFAPIFEQYSRDPHYTFAKADITDDDNPLWDRYDIPAVPTVIAFKNGLEASRRNAVHGFGLTEEDFTALLKQL